MSVAKHHAEWLSLVEASGPFLSLPVLADVFPQGLDAHDSEHAGELRLAFEEWEDDQQGRKPTPGLQREWIRYVLRATLGYGEKVLLEGQAIPTYLSATAAEHGETLRPDWVLADPRKESGDLKPRLLIQYLPAGQSLEKPLADKRWTASPATRMMELLHSTGVRLGLVTNGHQWMLVNAPRGESTGFISWYTPLWFEEHLTLRAFRSLLGAERFFSVPEEETIESLLAKSAVNQQEVTDQLGFQVRKAVEVLVQALDAVDKTRNRQLLKDVPVTEVYEAVLTVMMRLVVLFSAEERKLLLLGDEFYDQHYAVSTLREQLRQLADRRGEEVLEFRFDAWCRLLSTFRAVHGGAQHDAFQLSPYNGSLFNPDRYPFLEGRLPGTKWRETEAEPVPINNRIVLHLLEALQVLQMRGPGGSIESRRLSFRTLDVEQIGHVYEGLLDHTAVRADSPVLGLSGTKGLEPEVPLADLERERDKGEGGLVEYLKEVTKRSDTFIKKALAAVGDDLLLRDAQEAQRLRTACGNDDKLLARVRPYAGLLRRDTMGYPVVITAGSVYVTEGEDRRTTGTHYTPRSLTEEIVRYALEPLVYEGVAEGKPREEWRLRSAAELLALKVCDVACGSGAFLVQACRYLAERLLEAWAEVEQQNPGSVVVTPEGALSQAEPSERPLPYDLEERLIVARRLVADRCLYGVDKNPMAVEMAKLSLWLVTMQKDRPFSFLDHVIKAGDSLLGVTSSEQLEAFDLDHSGGTQIRIIAALCKPLLEEASAARRELEGFAAESLDDVRRKEQLHARAEAAATKVRFIADLLVGEALQTASKLKKRWARSAAEAEAEQEAASSSAADQHEALEQLVMSALEEWKNVDLATDERVRELRERAARLLGRRRPFHWALEFPEVFTEDSESRGGFDAIIGNPPFKAGAALATLFGEDWREYVVQYIGKNVSTRRGQFDLCVPFFLRARSLCHGRGIVGGIATNSFAQGDSRIIGLSQLYADGFEVIRARNDVPWPGAAATHVCLVWIARAPWAGERRLDGREVAHISDSLSAEAGSSDIHLLAENKGVAFRGAMPYGEGFFIGRDEAARLLAQRAENRVALMPYLIGDDLNSDPEQSPARFIINFKDWKLTSAEKSGDDLWCAEEFPELLQIVEERVKPQRLALKENNSTAKHRRQYWWQFSNRADALTEALRGKSKALAISRTTAHLAFAFVPTDIVLSERLVVIADDSLHTFGVLQSTVHEVWAFRPGTMTQGTTRTYFVAEAFETFPRPKAAPAIRASAGTYYAHRREIMRGNGIGLTETYNRLHDPKEASADIRRLRELHVEMDNAVATAYGWSYLDLAHGFHQTKQGVRFTISEAARREVLDRLLRLNHERYAEEVAAGLHEKGAKKKFAGAKKGRGRKQKTRPAEASANDDAPGDGKLFDFELQKNLF